MGPPAQLVDRPEEGWAEGWDGGGRRSPQWASTPFRAFSDRRLARRASRGDQRAIAAIFERYRQELYGFCLGLLGEPQDAQDALQNTMVKVLRALPGEEREIALRPWLYRIAHNEAIELRRCRRLFALPQVEKDETGEQEGKDAKSDPGASLPRGHKGIVQALPAGMTQRPMGRR